MFTRRSLALGFLAAGLLAAQDTPPTVQVTGDVKQALTLSADDLAKLPVPRSALPTLEWRPFMKAFGSMRS